MENEKTNKLTEIFQQLSKEGQMEALYHAGLVFKVETAMRRQYGLSAEGYPGQAGQAAAQPQAGAWV
jgi:hypothetical protein